MLVFGFVYPSSAIEVSFKDSQAPHLRLSPPTLAALESGVSLKFVNENAATTNYMLFDWHSDRKRTTFTISHHALSNHYLVRHSVSNNMRSFANVRQALDYLEKQIVLQANQFNAEHLKTSPANHSTSFRLFLDIYDLPSPMRLNAFWSKQWRLSTGWITWT